MNFGHGLRRELSRTIKADFVMKKRDYDYCLIRFDHDLFRILSACAQRLRVHARVQGVSKVYFFVAVRGRATEELPDFTYKVTRAGDGNL